jgi:hypothetical protein
MGIFHNHAIGFVLAAGALLVANTSDAKVPVAPLKSATIITQVAQGCGPGGWRDPYGRCRYGGGYGHGYGRGSPCPRGFSVQDGVCKPYRGY